MEPSSPASESMFCTQHPLGPVQARVTAQAIVGQMEKILQNFLHTRTHCSEPLSETVTDASPDISPSRSTNEKDSVAGRRLGFLTCCQCSETLSCFSRSRAELQEVACYPQTFVASVL